MVSDFLPIPLTLYYPFLAFSLLAIALIGIPRLDIRRLFAESLILGFTLSFIFNVAMVGLGMFYYRYAGAFSVLGSPIWLNFAWSPSIMVFLHFKPAMSRKLQFLAYLASFSLIGALLDNTLHKLGLLVYVHWSPVIMFFVALAWHYAAALVHERIMNPPATRPVE